MPAPNPGLNLGRKYEGFIPIAMPLATGLGSGQARIQTRSADSRARSGYTLLTAPLYHPISFSSQLQPSYTSSDFCSCPFLCHRWFQLPILYLGGKREGDMWLQRFKSDRLGTPVLCWIFSCETGQKNIYGLCDILLLTLKMVMDKGNMLNSSVSSLITQKEDPSEVSQSVGEERNKSGF